MPTVVGPDTWVRIEYELRDGRGNLLESTEAPIEFVYGFSDLLPALEAALEGAAKGDAVNVSIPPEDAYGTRDESNVFKVDRSEFPDSAELEVDDEFVAVGEDGTQLSMRVEEVQDDYVVVDANHPLAGETLNFQVRILDLRAATEDEILAAQAAASDNTDPEAEPS
jgi:FKBP-type peptidyl-prolyl cis-trans isomerase SlyD